MDKVPESKEAIQESFLLLRRNSIQKLFNGYEYDIEQQHHAALQEQRKKKLAHREVVVRHANTNSIISATSQDKQQNSQLSLSSQPIVGVNQSVVSHSSLAVHHPQPLHQQARSNKQIAIGSSASQTNQDDSVSENLSTWVQTAISAKVLTSQGGPSQSQMQVQRVGGAKSNLR